MSRKVNTLTEDQKIVRRSRRAFAAFGALAVIAIGGWIWLYNTKGGPGDAAIRKPLRKVMQVNEKIFARGGDGAALAKTYPVSKADRNVRVNGDLGMNSALDAAAWRMAVVRAPGDTLHVGMDELKRLPRTEIVFDFKCIEGWDQITHWGGVKMSDFISAYGLRPQTEKKYMGLQTPDGEYYVGLDMPSAIHPQTILCYEMNGKPLPPDQGAPLRLIIPVKYGIKHLKRIGTMFFADTPPRDYWAEQGYDYYAGH